LNDSLDAPPPERGLTRARPSADAVALKLLSVTTRSKPCHRARYRRQSGDVCQLPLEALYREHVKRCAASSCSFSGESHIIPDERLAARSPAPISSKAMSATLSGRLAQIRTYTYARISGLDARMACIGRPLPARWKNRLVRCAA